MLARADLYLGILVTHRAVHWEKARSKGFLLTDGRMSPSEEGDGMVQGD